MKFNIQNIEIGDDALPVVIPDIGINHGGNLQVAKEMVTSAHRAGARIVKHQTHIIEDEMTQAAKHVIPGNSAFSIYDIMDSCALSADAEYELMRYTESLGMVFLSTPFSRAAANRLMEFGVSAFKIGSGEMNNYPLIDHIASFGKPMIVSTGMNSIDNVRKAVSILNQKKISYALLHTTNLYPTKPHQVRLGAMQQMMVAFPGIPVGLSDHTLNNNACISAISLGASVVERHYTDKMDRQGPDIACSMDEVTLKQLLQAAKEVPLMLGGDKKALYEEQVTIDFAFATVCTIRPIYKGEKFTPQNVWVKRPGIGKISAEYYSNVLGKMAAVDIPADIQLEPSMIL